MASVPNTDTTAKNIFVILGVARSGTSVLARALKSLGVHLGHKLTAAGKWNPTGFWEDHDVVYQINQHLLDQLHFRWDSVKLLETNFTPKELLAHQTTATNIIRERMKDITDWGFKDPRTVRILPFWQAIFQNLNLNEHYVIALRNPLCSAQSFSDLGTNDIEKGLLLWLMHLIPAIEQTHNKKRLVVSYEKIMQNPQHELSRIQRYFNLPPCAATELQQFEHAFLNKRLDHYHYTQADLIAHPATAISPLILKCYNCLLRLSRDELHFEDAEFTATWLEIQQEFQQNYANYCYIDKLLVENTQFRKKLRSIQRTVSWKMILPLRIIETALKSLRKWIRSQQSIKMKKT
jgi:hypothetical protein